MKPNISCLVALPRVARSSSVVFSVMMGTVSPRMSLPVLERGRVASQGRYSYMRARSR